jgi:hypothetical protein
MREGRRAVASTAPYATARRTLPQIKLIQANCFASENNNGAIIMNSSIIVLSSYC